MAIYTPCGLKIRLSTSDAFALMARLYPKVDAFTMLKTVEGLEVIPSMLAYITGICVFSFRLNPYQIAIYTAVISIIGMLIITFGVIVPVLPKLGVWYSYLSGFGLLFIALIIYGFLFVGWQGVAGFFIGKIIAGSVNWMIEFWFEKKIHGKLGQALSTSELNFFNAYRIYANKLGMSTDISLSEQELKEDNWQECFQDLEIKWPEVVRRFT